MSRLSIAFLSLVCASSAVGLCGCGSTAKVDARTVTVGKELQDLEDARNKGLLTEDEYQAKRKEIMKRK